MFTSVPTTSIRTAKLVRWLHEQTVWVTLVSTTSHPKSDHCPSNVLRIKLLIVILHANYMWSGNSKKYFLYPSCGFFHCSTYFSEYSQKEHVGLNTLFVCNTKIYEPWVTFQSKFFSYYMQTYSTQNYPFFACLLNLDSLKLSFLTVLCSNV